MNHVMAFDPPAPARAHPEMVDGVVRAVVREVTDPEPDEERVDGHDADDGAEEKVEAETHRDARAERHHQSIRVLREVVMHSVQDEVHAALPEARPEIV